MVSASISWTATLAAGLVGCIAGFATAFLNLKLRILHILAGILTAIALYSINLRIMDRPNIGLINSQPFTRRSSISEFRRFTRRLCFWRSPLSSPKF